MAALGTVFLVVIALVVLFALLIAAVSLPSFNRYMRIRKM